MVYFTPKQEAIFNWVQIYIDENGYKPKQKEIALHFNITRDAVRDRLHYIELKGWLLTDYGWLRIPDHLMQSHRKRVAA